MNQPPLCFRESGNGIHETLLFLHGGGASSRMWMQSLATFDAYHCLAPDLPGHGESAQIEPFTIASSVAGLAALIRQQAAAGKVSLLAVSLGVPIALALCKQHPEMIQRIFLSGPTPRLGRLLAGLTELSMRPLLRWGSPALRVQIAARSLGLSEAQIAPMREDLERLNMPLVRAMNAVAAEQGDPVAMAAPTLVVAGAREPSMVRKQACAIARATPHAEARLAPNAGHAWMYELPVLFDATVRAWMKDALPPAELLPLPC